MKCIIIFIISCVIISIDAYAVSAGGKIKYPYTLITNDYGILNDNDLGAFAWEGTAKPFSAEASRGEYNIWQCFPRDNVMVTLSDTGQSSFVKKRLKSSSEWNIKKSRDMIRQVLRKMRDEGEISVSSGGRGALWKKTFK